MAEGLFVFPARIDLIGVGAKPSWIDLTQIDMRLAIHNPVDQFGPESPAHQESAGKALSEPEIAFAPGRTTQRQVVGRSADGSAHVRLDADFAQYRYEVECCGPVVLHGFHVFRQQVCAEPVGHAITREVLQVCRALVGAEHQAVALLPDIAVDGFIAQHGHFRQSLIFALPDLRHGLGYPVLVQDRKAGQVHPQHFCSLLDIVTRRCYNVLADDVTLIGADFPLA